MQCPRNAQNRIAEQIKWIFFVEIVMNCTRWISLQCQHKNIQRDNKWGDVGVYVVGVNTSMQMERSNWIKNFLVHFRIGSTKKFSRDNASANQKTLMKHRKKYHSNKIVENRSKRKLLLKKNNKISKNKNDKRKFVCDYLKIGFWI